MNTTTKTQTRGIRNRNPMNIRYSPSNGWHGRLVGADKQDPSFEEFRTMRYGFRAGIKLITNYMSRYHLTSPATIIGRWAPRNENNTDQYVKDVCRLTGLGGKQNLIPFSQEVHDLIWAMAIVESGHGIESYKQDYEDAWEEFWRV